MIIKSLRSFYIFLCIVLFVSTIYSQTNTLLNNVNSILKEKQDSVRLNKLSDLVFENAASNPQGALNVAHIELTEAAKTKLPKFIAIAFNDIATCYYYSGNYDSCIHYSNHSLKIRSESKDTMGIISSLNKIAISHQEMGQYQSAANVQFRILKLAEILGNNSFLASTYNNLSLLFYNLNNFDKSLAYGKLSFIHASKQDEKGVMAEALGSMANAFERKNMRDSALVYLKQAGIYFKEIGNIKNLSVVYQSIALNYRFQNKLPLALDNYKQAYTLANQLENPSDKAFYAANVASVLIDLGRKEEAKLYLIVGKKLAEQENNLDALNEVYSTLLKFYIKSHNSDSAMHYLVLRDSVKNLMINNESIKQINELNILYETEKKNTHIVKLNNENLSQKIQIQRRNTLLVIALGSVLILLLLAFLFYNRYKAKQDAILQTAIIKEQDEAARAVIAAEENERTRMSQTLHDGLGQLLSAAKMNMQAAMEHLSANNNASHIYMNALQLVDDSILEMRSVSHQMVTNNVVRKGLANALKELIEKIENNRLKITLDVNGLLQEIHPETQLVVYRILQESINNVIKHANADNLNIVLNVSDKKLLASITDNGKGFDTDNVKTRKGIGLDNIETRIKFLKGSYNINSSKNNGTTLQFEIPL